ncbi:MAG: C_GCAxxG_C_C family protein [bacterium]|nr:C_GCAxxG_C_C family protein [bacterium]
MNKRVQTALDLFNENNTCSQAVLCAYAEDLGLKKVLALKIACPFGGGIGCRGDLCGAYTGACMVIGLKHGRVNPEDQEARDHTDQLVNELTEKFKNQNGGKLLCNDLLGCDRSTAEGVEFAKENNLHEVVCAKAVCRAVEILEEILET